MSTDQPIIPGFYPDPSICRAGDTYYIVNSSFEYLPGLPIHSSTDLVTWTPVGNALTRTGQIAEHAGVASSSIYAPTIRYHDGRFWIAGTNVLTHGGGVGQFIITADDPAGPWSDPAHVPGTIGIDPDLAWDEDGVCRLTWTSLSAEMRGIASVPIDPSTGETLGEPKLLWQGTGGAHPEGPHLYRLDGWWYLLLAEGGTARGHAATIARARTLDGPFESAPTNPILTHRGRDHPVQNTGHADVVQLGDGDWAMVYLGVRPRGVTPGFHVNGRETFLAGIDWIDGWPVVDESRFTVTQADHSFDDTFDTATLDQRWLGVGMFPSSFTRRAEGPGLVIDADSGGPGIPLLATRVRDTEWSASARFDATAGTGRLVMRIDKEHGCALTFDGEAVEAAVTIGPAVRTFSRLPLERGALPTLRISVRRPETTPHWTPDEVDIVELSVVTDDGSEQVLASFDGRHISTEVAGRFTGRVVGVEGLSGRVVLREMRYVSGARPAGEPTSPAVEADTARWSDCS
ncbi:glycoside hydrolase family 43 protein [Salinactinospora qingdaonensis]|uniref:Glycoside hydrolase family 43 protein n=1 Tax=Salinactinospora qingdaonensis TaxID=702744 RepID=A0ABP7FUX5_9ACTN